MPQLAQARLLRRLGAGGWGRTPSTRAFYRNSAGKKDFYEVTAITIAKDGKSTFGSLRIFLEPHGEIGLLSPLLPGKGIKFRRTPGTYDFDWHCAPTRQFIVNLDASVQVTVGTGETKVLEKGEIFYVEDVTGAGHYSQAVDGMPRSSLFIPVDAEALEQMTEYVEISRPGA
ncbi:hypothetical protein AAMO2058_000048400 [Amorphochlora amoebiformis]